MNLPENVIVRGPDLCDESRWRWLHKGCGTVSVVHLRSPHGDGYPHYYCLKCGLMQHADTGVYRLAVPVVPAA